MHYSIMLFLFHFFFLLLNDHFTYKCAFHFHNVSTKSTVGFVNSQYLVTKPKVSRMDLYFVWAYFIHITNRAKEFIKTKMGNRLLSFRQNMLKLLTDIGIATVHFDTTIEVQPFFCGFIWQLRFEPTDQSAAKNSELFLLRCFWLVMSW